jgi:chromosome partitioning protein
MSFRLAILNQKGGVGKTTTAINLSSFLARDGHSVLLVDLDPQANATSGLGVMSSDEELSTYEVLLNSTTLNSAIKPTHISKLDILPSKPALAALEVELINLQGREGILKNVLNSLNYEFIIIDCPPALGLLTINALVAATSLIIPVQSEYYALEGLGQLLSIIQRVRETLNPNLNILGVLLTMYDKRTSLSVQVGNELNSHFGDKMFKTVIPRNVRLAEAPSFGLTIFEHDKWSKGAKAYKLLTKEVEKRVYG